MCSYSEIFDRGLFDVDHRSLRATITQNTILIKCNHHFMPFSSPLSRRWVKNFDKQIIFTFIRRRRNLFCLSSCWKFYFVSIVLFNPNLNPNPNPNPSPLNPNLHHCAFCFIERTTNWFFCERNFSGFSECCLSFSL